MLPSAEAVIVGDDGWADEPPPEDDEDEPSSTSRSPVPLALITFISLMMLRARSFGPWTIKATTQRATVRTPVCRIPPGKRPASRTEQSKGYFGSGPASTCSWRCRRRCKCSSCVWVVSVDDGVSTKGAMRRRRRLSEAIRTSAWTGDTLPSRTLVRCCSGGVNDDQGKATCRA